VARLAESAQRDGEVVDVTQDLNATVRSLLAGNKPTSLADNIMSQLKPLKEADRLFLVEQIRVWSKKLAAKK
jgi:hypothetical protein